MKNTRIKVAIYCRLSEEDRNKQAETDDSNSIQNQKSMLLQHSIEQGWEVYNIYSDDDYTGSDRNRPEFNRLLEDAKQRKFDIILCKTQSRFTRELELVEKYIHGLFPIWGIRFVSIVDNADTDNKGNKKSRQINGLVNEWYLEDMSENIRSVLINRRKNGYHIGSFALYGYLKDPEQKGRLIIDEEAACVVREVFTLFSQGYGKTAIARILNKRQIPNPTEYKRLKGLRYQQPGGQHSTLWKYFSISDMLTNEIYIGNMVQGKYGSVSYKTKQNKPRPREQWYRVEGTHEAIIDRELWDRVQALIAQKAKPFTIGTIGIFSRKVRCMYCGYTMRSTKTKDRYYLKCPTHQIKKDECIGAFIAVSRLERIVKAQLDRLSEEYLDKEELEQKVQLNHDLKGRIKTIESEINLYQKKILEYDHAVRESYIDKVNGIIAIEDYQNVSAYFSEEKNSLNKRIKELKKQLERIQRIVQQPINRKELIEQYTNTEHLDREIVDKLIDYILVGRKNPDTKAVPIEIHWNF